MQVLDLQWYLLLRVWEQLPSWALPRMAWQPAQILARVLWPHLRDLCQAEREGMHGNCLLLAHHWAWHLYDRPQQPRWQPRPAGEHQMLESAQPLLVWPLAWACPGRQASPVLPGPGWPGKGSDQWMPQRLHEAMALAWGCQQGRRAAQGRPGPWEYRGRHSLQQSPVHPSGYCRLTRPTQGSPRSRLGSRCPPSVCTPAQAQIAVRKHWLRSWTRFHDQGHGLWRKSHILCMPTPARFSDIQTAWSSERHMLMMPL